MAKFLNYEDRLEIESGLKEHMTFTEIGKKLGRDRTTITKEIRNYSMEQDTGYGSYPHNTCKYRKACKRKKVCGTNDCKHPLISVCKQCESICNRYCEHFEEEVCTHRFKPPYVCNGCSEVKKCTLTKTLYDHHELTGAGGKPLHLGELQVGHPHQVQAGGDALKRKPFPRL